MISLIPVEDQVALTFRGDAAGLRETLSAAYLTPEGHLWLVGDESLALERLTRDPDGGFGDHRSFPLADLLDLPGDEGDELDLEALAFDGRSLWLAGSHAARIKKPRDAEDTGRLRWKAFSREPARCLLARVPLRDGEPVAVTDDPDRPGKKLRAAVLPASVHGNLLTAALRKDAHIGPVLRAGLPGKANGLDIEGMEVAGGRLFLGLRGPVLLDHALVIEVAPRKGGRGELALGPVGKDGRRYRKHFVNLRGLGVRDLCLEGGDLYILAGPTMFLAGPAYLFHQPAFLDQPEGLILYPDLVGELPSGLEAGRAEGICRADALTGRRSLLVAYDAAAARVEGETGVKADVVLL